MLREPFKEGLVEHVSGTQFSSFACALMACVCSAARADAPAPPPPENPAEFADSLSDAALTNDPDAIYRKNGQRRTVDLGGGWSAWLDRTQASQLRNPTSRVINAGGRETRLGFDFAGLTGLRARIATADLETARANELRLASAPAAVGGFAWALGLDQLRASEIGIVRADASALASYRFSPAWLLQAGAHRATLRDENTGADARANFARAVLRYQPQAWTALTLSAQAWRAVGSEDDGRVSLNADYALAGGGRLYAGTSPRLSLLAGGGVQASQTFAHVAGAQTPLSALIGNRAWGDVYGEWRGKSLADRSDQVLASGWRNRFALPARFSGELRLEHTEPLAGGTAQRINTVGAGFSRSNVPENTVGTWFEYTHSDTVHSGYALIKYTQRVSEDAVATLRLQLEDRQPNDSVGGQTTWKVSSGLGWREPLHKRLGLLWRYSYVDKDAREPGEFDRAAHIGSVQFQYDLGGQASVAARYAARRAREDGAAGLIAKTSHLVAARAIWPLRGRWDLSGHAAAVRDPVLQPKHAFGLELGYRISRKVVLVGGVNARGFADSELEAEDRFRKGAYLRLRFSVEGLVAQWLDAPRQREGASSP